MWPIGLNLYMYIYKSWIWMTKSKQNSTLPSNPFPLFIYYPLYKIISNTVRLAYFAGDNSSIHKINKSLVVSWHAAKLFYIIEKLFKIFKIIDIANTWILLSLRRTPLKYLVYWDESEGWKNAWPQATVFKPTLDSWEVIKDSKKALRGPQLIFEIKIFKYKKVFRANYNTQKYLIFGRART